MIVSVCQYFERSIIIKKNDVCISGLKPFKLIVYDSYNSSTVTPQVMALGHINVVACHF